MYMQQTARDGTLPQVNIVLLGARGVGKSTFIQNSFDLRQLPSEVITSQKMSLDGIVYVVRLIEMRFREVMLDETKIKWPKNLKELGVPSIDGVLALCDVTDQEGFTDTKELLRTCSPRHFILGHAQRCCTMQGTAWGT
jgi:septin family protein